MTGAVLLLDKASGVTSRKASGEAARALGFRKYGHCGTLDPDATGLLPVLLGKATRLAPYLSGGTKRYSFVLVAGIGTDTLDMTGRVTSSADPSRLTREAVLDAMNGLTGTFMQEAPLFSAVRVEGKRAYRLARQGMNPEMPSREVTVSNWKAGELNNGRMVLEATVTSGTYVRALARDIGRAVGLPASADAIRRTAMGPFTVEEASASPCQSTGLLSMARAAGRVMVTVTLSQDELRRVLHGMDVPGTETGNVALLSPAGELAAIAAGNGSSLHPGTVLASMEDL